MTMSRNIFSKIAVASLVLFGASFVALADGGTYASNTPYSIFGVGDLLRGGSAYNKSMGGVGIGTRSNHFINALNPAAVTARDSLSLMVDYSMYEDNKFFKSGAKTSVSNTFNIGDLMVTFPIYKSMAMMVGIMPYSGMGFKYSDSYDSLSDDVMMSTGDVRYTAHGQGGMYNLFGALGASFFDRISIGVQYNFYFGDIIKGYSQTVSSTTAQGLNEEYDVLLNGGSFKFGLQYEQPIGNNTLCIGATYSMKAKLKGYYTDALAQVDTFTFNEGLNIPEEIGVGISFRGSDRWMIAFDYTRSDWRKSSFNEYTFFKASKGFRPAISEDFRLGFEIIPNRSDIRYYLKRCYYRAGAYYKKDYFTFDGHQINSYGLTLGATLPVFRWYNGITLGVDFGRRGTVENNLVRENYVNFSIGINLFDIWFQKPKYQ